jgi:hypothetical protein
MHDTSVGIADAGIRETVVRVGATADQRQGGLRCGRRHLMTGLRVGVRGPHGRIKRARSMLRDAATMTSLARTRRRLTHHVSRSPPAAQIRDAAHSSRRVAALDDGSKVQLSGPEAKSFSP